MNSTCTFNGQPVTCPEWLNAIAPYTVIIAVVAALIMIISLWKIFQKAGKPGWASIIPIYNLVVVCQIAGVSPWLVVLAIIPFVNIIVLFYVVYKFALSFGKGIGFTLGIIFLSIIFYPMLAFGSATYRGPAVS